MTLQRVQYIQTLSVTTSHRFIYIRCDWNGTECGILHSGLTCTLIAFQKCHCKMSALSLSLSSLFVCLLFAHPVSFSLTWQRNIMAFCLMILVWLDVGVMNVKAWAKRQRQSARARKKTHSHSYSHSHLHTHSTQKKWWCGGKSSIGKFGAFGEKHVHLNDCFCSDITISAKLNHWKWHFLVLWF